MLTMVVYMLASIEGEGEGCWDSFEGVVGNGQVMPPPIPTKQVKTNSGLSMYHVGVHMP